MSCLRSRSISTAQTTSDEVSPIFAIAALITFILAFLLALLGADTGKISLLFLGLSFVAAHMAFGGWAPWRRP